MYVSLYAPATPCQVFLRRKINTIKLEFKVQLLLYSKLIVYLHQLSVGTRPVEPSLSPINQGGNQMTKGESIGWGIVIILALTLGVVAITQETYIIAVPTLWMILFALFFRRCSEIKQELFTVLAEDFGKKWSEIGFAVRFPNSPIWVLCLAFIIMGLRRKGVLERKHIALHEHLYFVTDHGRRVIREELGLGEEETS